MFLQHLDIQKKIKSLNKNYKKIRFLKLNIFSKKEVQKILKKTKPLIIFYFAGQSSPQKSFKKKLRHIKVTLKVAKIS